MRAAGVSPQSARVILVFVSLLYQHLTAVYDKNRESSVQTSQTVSLIFAHIPDLVVKKIGKYQLIVHSLLLVSDVYYFIPILSCFKIYVKMYPPLSRLSVFGGVYGFCASDKMLR
jgi:hypothetical protein